MSEEPNLLNEEKEEILDQLDDVFFILTRIKTALCLDRAMDIFYERNFKEVNKTLLNIEKKVKNL